MIRSDKNFKFYFEWKKRSRSQRIYHFFLSSEDFDLKNVSASARKEKLKLIYNCGLIRLLILQPY
jgi:hypothetical protein